MSEPTTPNEGSSTMTGTDRTARITWSLIAEPSDLIAFGVCAALGPAGALELARHGDATALLRALDGELPSQATDPERAAPVSRAQRALERWRARLERIDVDAVRADARRRGIRILTPYDDEWPELLEDLQETIPHCLWLQGPGRLDALLGARAAALVGSRASTPTARTPR